MLFKGYVDVEIKGVQAEQMLDYLVRQDIPFYNLRRADGNTLKLTMKYRDAFFLKKVRKQFGCKITFQNRGGLPHLYSRRKKWAPIAIGILLSILLLFVVSNMIWKVEITGGSPEVRYKVEQLIDELGLKKGNFIQQAESISLIEMEIMNKIEHVSYVGIKKSGSSFHINIQEYKDTKHNQSKIPSDLVAKKAGTINDIYVTRGRPLVRVNDFVKKGDVLVTGFLADEGNVYTYSEGTILAEVWYNINATIDLQKERLKLVNEPVNKYSISIGKWEFFDGNNKEQRLLMEVKKPFYFLKWELPFAIYKKYYYDEKKLINEINDEQLMIDAIENQLKRKLGQSIELDYYKILHQKRDNDKVNIKLFVKLIEDISEEVEVNPKEKMKEEESEKEN